MTPSLTDAQKARVEEAVLNVRRAQGDKSYRRALATYDPQDVPDQQWKAEIAAAEERIEEAERALLATVAEIVGEREAERDALRSTLRAVLTNVRVARETVGEDALSEGERRVALCLDNAETAITRALTAPNP